MSTALAVDAFWDALERSSIVPTDLLRKVQQEIGELAPGPADSAALADELINRGILTRWQADKLLEGKHRGFIMGPYRILRPLGRGGMGMVYLAEHQMMRRRCAIKVLPKHSAADPTVVERFVREGQAIGALAHPNIVSAYDLNRAMHDRDEIYYLVMEYIDGQDLQRKVEEHGVVGYREAAELIRQAAEGLSHAHGVGVIHRDVKPANLLVDRAGVVKVLDLGLARFFHDPVEASLTEGQGRTVLGTADYLAPEQAIDSSRVDARADIYSLGMTFYFLLVGHAPFPEGTIAERLMAHQSRAPEPVERQRPDVPPSLLGILHRMIAKKADQRYSSAREVADTLNSWLQDNPPDSGILQRLARFGSMTRNSALPTRLANTAAGDTDEADLDLAPLDEERTEPSAAVTPPPGGDESKVARKAAKSADKQPPAAPSPAAEEPPPADLSRLEAEVVPMVDLGQVAATIAAAEPPKASSSGSHSADDLLRQDVLSNAAEPPLTSLASGTGLSESRRANVAKAEEKSILSSPLVWAATLAPVLIVGGILLYLFGGSDETSPPSVALVPPAPVAPSQPAVSSHTPAAAPAPSAVPPETAPSPETPNPASSQTPPSRAQATESQAPSPPQPTGQQSPASAGAANAESARTIDAAVPKPPSAEPKEPGRAAPAQPQQQIETPPKPPVQPAPTEQPPQPRTEPAAAPSPAPDDPSAMLANVTSLAFKFEPSIEKSPPQIKNAVAQKALETAERAGIQPDSNAPAVMRLDLRFDKGAGLYILGEVQVRGEGGKPMTIWKHAEPIAAIPQPPMNILRAGLGQFFNKFLKEHRQAAQAQKGHP